MLGFFVGQIMKATQGRANPQQVNALLRARTGGRLTASDCGRGSFMDITNAPDERLRNCAAADIRMARPFAQRPPMAGYQITHLKQLESESIRIIREVAAEFEKPVMLYSIGKDSTVLLHLARKAFYPGACRFRCCTSIRRGSFAR